MNTSTVKSTIEMSPFHPHSLIRKKSQLLIKLIKAYFASNSLGSSKAHIVLP
jgi:hypothetical protein